LPRRCYLHRNVFRYTVFIGSPIAACSTCSIINISEIFHRMRTSFPHAPRILLLYTGIYIIIKRCALCSARRRRRFVNLRRAIIAFGYLRLFKRHEKFIWYSTGIRDMFKYKLRERGLHESVFQLYSYIQHTRTRTHTHTHKAK